MKIKIEEKNVPVSRKGLLSLVAMLTEGEHQKVWKDANSIHWRLTQQIIFQPRFLVKILHNSFSAVVDYGAEIKDFVKTPDFQTESCIDCNFHLFAKSDIKIKKKREFGFFFLAKPMTVGTIIEAMKKRGLSPVNFQELVYFSQPYVELLKIIRLSSPNADFQTKEHVNFAHVVGRPPFIKGEKKPYVSLGTSSHYNEPKEKILRYPNCEVFLGVYE
jgi:hypothetical protein